MTFVSGERHTKGILWEYLAVFPTAQFHVKIFINKDGKFCGLWSITLGADDLSAERVGSS